MTATSFGPYFRLIGAHNAGEYEKVTASQEVWGREASTLATGHCVQAVPLARASTDNGYHFMTTVKPKESIGFPLVGPPILREVFWFEGSEGVELRENGAYVAIRVQDVKRGRG